MGKRIKGYLVFTSFLYRIAVHALMPVGLVAAGLWGGFHIGDIGLILTMALLTWFEIFSDSWMFGGIQAKDMEKMDYLKTSKRGMMILRDALSVDLIRKLLTAAGTITICYLAVWLSKEAAGETMERVMVDFTDFIGYESAGREAGFLIYLVLLSYTVSVLGTFLSRYGNSVYVNMLVAYGATVLMMMGLFGPGLRGYLYPWPWLFGLDLLLAVLGVGVSILTVRTAVKKMEESYHDE